jgi:hypothetical protein
MRPITFTLRFEGETVSLGDGRLWAESRAAAGIEEALCRTELDVGHDGSVEETGVLSFGEDASLTFRAKGALRTSPDPTIRHGTAVLEITGGSGKLAGACGFVTSNFLLSETGELTDHHLGLLFLERLRGRRH